MADLFRNSSSLMKAIWAVKLLLLVVGIISTFLLFKLTIIPYSFKILVTTLPSLGSCLSPPYIYILVNFIIITIAASSTFHQQTQPQQSHTEDEDATMSQTLQISHDIAKEYKSMMSVDKLVDSFPEISSDESCLRDSGEITSMGELEKKAEEEEEDTLEGTWKAITEGRRELKKSETFNHAITRGSEGARREMRKWETFSGGLRRERLPSQEELNRRVEAFIKKVNHDIRLERQQSDQRYLEMVNRSL